MNAFTKSQAIIPKVGGGISLIACTLIIRDISMKWHEKRSVPLPSVILFCISVANWLLSLFSFFLSTWMMPRDSGAFLAAGNTQSCTAQGFISTLTMVASQTYYTVLAILFWAIVQFGWSETYMKQMKIRLSFLIPPAIISLGVSIPPLFMEMYNPGSFTCSVRPLPIDCEDNPEVECIRGRGAWTYWSSVLIGSMVLGFIIVVFVLLLVRSVFQEEAKCDKYLSVGQERRRTNTKKTAQQGVRYVTAYLLSYITLYVLCGYKLVKKNAPPNEILSYFNLVLNPLLGFFYSLVYFRPRYITYRQRNPSETRFDALCNIFNIDLDETVASERMKRISSVFSATSILRNLSVTWKNSSTRTRSSEGSLNQDLSSPLIANTYGPESQDFPSIP